MSATTATATTAASATTASNNLTTSSPASNPSSDDPSRSRRLRRFSQLRAYTQLHFPSSTSSNNNNNNNNSNSSFNSAARSSSYRNSFSHRLSWLSPTSQQSNSAVVNHHNNNNNHHHPDYPSQTSSQLVSGVSSCPESDQPAPLTRYTSAPPGSSSSAANYRNSGAVVDLRPQQAPLSYDSSSSSSFNDHHHQNNNNDINNNNNRSSRLISRLRRTSTVPKRNRLSQAIFDSGSSSREATSASGSEMRPSESTNTAAAAAADNRGGSGSAESLGRSTTTENRSTTVEAPNRKATIRFYPYHDPSHTSKPSLPFVPVSRTLPSDSCMFRVGRYSERDGVPIPNPSEPSDAPVGFKSKVVSRKHCEFLYLNSQWHVKDIGSSSGTFLNHMRLSQPNMVSRLYAIKDGDIVQLGIDFRGGEEMIFRCVRIRIECNRSWQQQPNEFNKNTESLIRNLGKGDTADYAGCRECSICLGSVLRPYQCLFMAACAHVWHYKCVSRLIHTPEYPMFQCPNCRAYTDLSAEVDDSNDFEEAQQQEEPEPENRSRTASPAAHASSHNGEDSNNSIQAMNRVQPRSTTDESDLVYNVENMNLHDGNVSTSENNEDINDPSHSPVPGPNNNNNNNDNNHSNDVVHTANIDIPRSRNPSSVLPHNNRQLQSRVEMSEDNPMTPRNDSGPLAFDGRAGMLQQNSEA